MSANDTCDVVIVGTGFSGLGMAIALQKEGKRSFVILEQGDEVGGVWRENRYPGCACDVPAPLYSFSFEPNPRWSRLFAERGEIFSYLNACADKYGLRRHIRFGRRVSEAAFDEARAVWTVSSTNGDRFTARHLVLGMGGLSRPALPQIDGMDRFSGKTFHSAAWDQAHPLEGKRVAVIGTGASAIQIVPQVAERASRLAVFQRTPTWILPKSDRPIGLGEQALYARVPFVQRLLRSYIYATWEVRGVGFTIEPRLMRIVELWSRAHIAKQIRDPALRARVTPNDVPGCKRILLSDDYFPALSKPHVELVTDPIAHLDAHGIVTRDGRARAFDAIIYATGFNTTGLPLPLRVRGIDGIDLNDAWRDGMEAYLGTNVAGYPNMHILVGPNTVLGHSSMVFMIEAQVHYALALMRAIDARGAAFADVRREAQAAWNAQLISRQRRTVWSTGCSSWYLDARGRNPTAWPGLTLEFYARTRRAHVRDYVFGNARNTSGAGARRATRHA